MSKPILVGLDPLHEDQAPLHLATGLARATGATVVAVAGYLHDRITNAVTGGAVERDLRAYATARLRDVTAASHAEVVVAGGLSPAQVLHEIATERDAGIIVIGSTRKGHIGRVTPGSTAERMLHGAQCPVAVAPAGLSAGWAPRRIGVGFVDRPEGHEALRAGAVLAAACGGSLKAVTAIEPVLWSSAALASAYDPDGFAHRAEAIAERSLEDALAQLPGDLEAGRDVVLGSPVGALERLSHDVDLLVCGSRGYGPIRSVLLGGVTHRLARQTHCPILIVPRATEPALERLLDREELTAT